MMRIVHIADQELEIPKPKSKKRIFEEGCALLLAQTKHRDKDKADAAFGEELRVLRKERDEQKAILDNIKKQQTKKGQVLYARPQLT